MLSPSLLQRILVRADWQFAFDDCGFRTHATERWAYLELSEVRLIEGFFWSRIELSAAERKIVLKGLAKRLACSLEVLWRAMPAILSARAAAGTILREQRYVPNRAIRLVLQPLTEAGVGATELRTVKELMSKHGDCSEALLRSLEWLSAWLDEDYSTVASRNDRFIAGEVAKYQAYFSSLEAYPLSSEQTRAAVVFEDRNLVVASAGSGKTSTLLAKIGYALEAGLMRPDEILALTFNKATQEELRKNCIARFPALTTHGERISAMTFHSLGMHILGSADGAMPSVAKWATEGGVDEGKVVETIVEELATHDEGFAQALITFVALWGRSLTEELAGSRRAGQAAGDESARGRRGGISERVTDMVLGAPDDYRQVLDDAFMVGTSELPTLQGEIVASGQECWIANWLFIHGIAYEYERPYFIRTATAEHRQYTPDFYYPDIDCWHEHYAFDASGRAPDEYAEDYATITSWRRAIHKQHSARYFETLGAHFENETIGAVLERHLRSFGLSPTRKSWEELAGRIRKYGLPAYYGMFRTAIKHIKSNALTGEAMRLRAQTLDNPLRASAFLDVLLPIFHAYQKRLAAASCIDFEDMVHKATAAVREKRYRSPFRFILVDEFQDISVARAELLKALLEGMPEATLFAVGDDWQSINRFAGADISVMTNFRGYFGYTATNYLHQTFRFSQELASAATKFVEKNPAQLQKHVVAHRKQEGKPIHLIGFYDKAELREGVQKELDSLARTGGNGCSVLFLGRYRHIVESARRTGYSGPFQFAYSTIHKAKGGQADYVFLLGLTGKPNYDFPSTIADDPLLELVMPTPETYSHAEERRLFYVALTRATRRVYLCTDASRPSCFVMELIEDAGSAGIGGIEAFTRKASGRCPECKLGHRVLRTGPQGPFYGCSRYPQCSYPRVQARVHLRPSGAPKRFA